MGRAGGRTRALMAEPFLDDPQRHSPFQQMGGIGVPPRMDGSICRDATLAHHRFEGLLEGGGGQGRRLRPGGEQPGAGPCALPVRPS